MRFNSSEQEFATRRAPRGRPGDAIRLRLGPAVTESELRGNRCRDTYPKHWTPDRVCLTALLDVSAQITYMESGLR
jgi:hypothetical protein